ncbi:MAG TPA: hypothetical protein VL551_14695 [Actinospica sp.]|jgi:hypothetical protein|nr:hypothetical protein [Actinospica sp.]
MGEANRLRELVADNDWTYQAFSAQFEQAARRVAERDKEPRLARVSVSESTFRRWTAGALRTSPNGDVRRVLTELFDCPADELFAPAPVVVRAPAPAVEAPRVSIRENIAMAARNALRFTAMSQTGTDSAVIEDLMAEAARIAALYPTTPLYEFLGDLVNLQEVTYQLLESRQRIKVQRDLHLIAALSSGLLAKASHDQADPRNAMILARAAYVSAEDAGHPGLQGWIRGIQALTAYWAGWTQQAADFAAQAQNETLAGTVTAWLPALEARAHASLGDHDRAHAALKKAQTARDHLHLSDLDEFGGLLTFPAAQQLYYRAEALVLDDPTSPAALEAANQAVTAYSDPDQGHWAFGDEAGSRAHQAVALIASEHFDGAAESLEPVFNLPTAQRTHGIAVCVQRAKEALPAPAAGQTRLINQLRRSAEEFDHSTLKALTK